MCGAGRPRARSLGDSANCEISSLVILDTDERVWFAAGPGHLPATGSTVTRLLGGVVPVHSTGNRVALVLEVRRLDRRDVRPPGLAICPLTPTISAPELAMRLQSVGTTNPTNACGAPGDSSAERAQSPVLRSARALRIEPIAIPRRQSSISVRTVCVCHREGSNGSGSISPVIALPKRRRSQILPWPSSRTAERGFAHRPRSQASATLPQRDDRRVQILA